MSAVQPQASKKLRIADCQPDPKAWPECAECKTAFVLRRCAAFSDGHIRYAWYWQRDCKHKRANTEMHIVEGYHQ